MASATAVCPICDAKMPGNWAEYPDYPFCSKRCRDDRPRPLARRELPHPGRPARRRVHGRRGPGANGPVRPPGVGRAGPGVLQFRSGRFVSGPPGDDVFHVPGGRLQPDARGRLGPAAGQAGAVRAGPPAVPGLARGRRPGPGRPGPGAGRVRRPERPRGRRRAAAPGGRVGAVRLQADGRRRDRTTPPIRTRPGPGGRGVERRAVGGGGPSAAGRPLAVRGVHGLAGERGCRAPGPGSRGRRRRPRSRTGRSRTRNERRYWWRFGVPKEQ